MITGAVREHDALTPSFISLVAPWSDRRCQGHGDQDHRHHVHARGDCAFSADCGKQGLLLWGMRASVRPANADYPLEHGRPIYFWPFIVALMLLSMGGMFSIYEGMH